MENDTLLQKWLNGELSESELKDFEKSADFEQYQSIVENAKNFKASNFETVADYETFKTNKLSSETQKRTFSKVFMPILKMAGVFIVLFGLYTLLLNDSFTTITTVAGEKTNVTLPDTSEIVLNAASSVTFDEKNWKEYRTVQLEGEAYFKVAKGATFDVVSQKDTVRVLGTQFNVKKRTDYFEVTCYEGSVKVITGKHERILAPGDQVVMLHDTIVERKLNDAQPNWTQNISTFSAVPLREVFAELERQFGVTVSTEHIDVHRLFTGGFQHEELQKALQSITVPMNIRFEFASETSIILHENNQ